MITLQPVDDCLVLTLDRPDKLNALNFGALHELDERLDDAERSGARAMIVTGAGTKAFCAGADIDELRLRALSDQHAGARLGQRVFQRIADLPMASIAVINGYAFGGGLELALACTFRLAARTARMGLPEITLGLIPGYGGTQRLPRVVGAARALEMVMTGRPVNGEEAERIGLVNELYEGDPIEAGLQFARGFTKHSLVALRLARDAVTRSVDVALAEGLRIEADLSTLAYQTSDAAEGMDAFLEKREPRFTDA